MNLMQTSLAVVEPGPGHSDLNVGFALALNEFKRLKKGSCAVVAICCNSFTAMLLVCMFGCGGYPLIVFRLPGLEA